MFFEPFSGQPLMMGINLASGLLFWSGVVLFAIWAVRALVHHSSMVAAPIATAPTAREILDTRLAKGEITADEYEQAKAALGGW